MVSGSLLCLPLVIIFALKWILVKVLFVYEVYTFRWFVAIPGLGVCLKVLRQAIKMVFIHQCRMRSDPRQIIQV